MKNRYHIILILITTISFTFLYACSSADSNEEVFEDINETTLIDADKAALLFMLEEEKLARDTYIYLNNVWSINQFNNINKSEQTHMDAVENLLIQNNIAYTILPMGEFENQNLQNYYNQFKIDGAKSKSNALQIASSVEKRIARALPDFSIDKFAVVILIVSAKSLLFIFRLANITSRFTIIAIGYMVKSLSSFTCLEIISASL